MNSAIFYVDESGDLGWDFAAPFRKGGSSRHLTVATLVCPSNDKHLPKRLVMNLYKQFKWNPKEEKKWSRMIVEERKEFAISTLDLVCKHPSIKLFSITVAKEKVTGHMKKDGNKLYNYMIKLSLIDEMAKYDKVTLIPDSRSVRVTSGNSLHDYLWINLTYEKQVETDLQTMPCDSACTKNVQFVDMLAGLVQHHYEDSNNECWDILHHYIISKRLFF